MANPTSDFPDAPPRFCDNGSGQKLLQPANQVDNVAAVASTGATNTTPYGYTQAQANAIVGNINAIRTALITAGIMKES